MTWSFVPLQLESERGCWQVTPGLPLQSCAVPALPLPSCVTLGKTQGWMGNTGSHSFPPENFARKVSDIKDEALRHDCNLSK